MVVLEPSSDVYSDDRRWQQIDLAGVYTELSQRIKQVRRVARTMDDQFTVPGTNIRFGWDAIIGLVPGIGDVLTSVVSLVIVHHAWRLGTPFFVLVRMLGNIGVDLILGSVPILGDAFDVVWKANSKNARLLEQHSHPAELVTC
jgi:uncharacterized protein DUF4112